MLTGKVFLPFLLGWNQFCNGSLRLFIFLADMQPLDFWNINSIFHTAQKPFLMRKYEHRYAVELIFSPSYWRIWEHSEKNIRWIPLWKCTICCLKIRASLVVFQTKRDIKISQAPSNDEKLAGVLFTVRGDHLQFFKCHWSFCVYYCDPSLAKLDSQNCIIKIINSLWGDANGPFKGTLRRCLGVETTILTRYWEKTREKVRWIVT